MDSSNFIYRYYGDRFQRFLWTFLAVIAWPLLCANSCDREVPQACSIGEGPVVCDADQLPTCIHYCAPTADPSEADGESCITNPCDINGATGGVILCPEGFACIPNSSGSRFGTCEAQAPLYGCGASTAAGDDSSYACPTGTYCRPFDSGFSRPSWVDSGAPGMCMPYRLEGQTCQWINECHPGLHCRPVLGSEHFRCVRTCDDVDDCPCEVDGEEPVCQSEGSTYGICTTCFPLGEECDDEAGAPGCCGEAECEAVAEGVNMCCMPENADCETNDDCCGNGPLVCLGGSCERCGLLGEEQPEAGCCDPLVPRGEAEVCSRPCEWEGATVSDMDSCTVHGCSGTITCGTAGADCIANNTSVDDDCDNVDEDCDGRVDEHYPEGQNCQDTPAECQAGFVPDTPGQKSCNYPNEPCDYSIDTWNDSYCWQDPSTHVIWGPPSCAVADTLPNGCTGDSDCSPGEVCGPSGGTCSSGVAGCCERYSSSTGWYYVPCCQIDTSGSGDACWNPGDRNP